MNQRIWVVCQELPHQISNQTRQLIRKARSIHPEIELVKVTAVCIGEYEETVLYSLFAEGAHEVLYCKKKQLHPSMVADILVDLLNVHEPDLVLIPASEWGRCAAAEAAVKLGSGLTADCIDVQRDIVYGQNRYLFFRSAINSTMIAQIECVSEKVPLCLCKNNVFHIHRQYEQKGTVKLWDSLRCMAQYIVPQIVESSNHLPEQNLYELENAKIVFGVGRGVHNRQIFDTIVRVAQKYGAVIMGTRGSVENSLISKQYQVGQSGISISPDLYVAIGISGAIQHMVGVQSAKTILAINTDREAPVFTYADYGIIDDVQAVMELLLKI